MVRSTASGEAKWLSVSDPPASPHGMWPPVRALLAGTRALSYVTYLGLGHWGEQRLSGLRAMFRVTHNYPAAE